MNNINNTNTNTNDRHVSHDFFSTPMTFELAEKYFYNFENYKKLFSERTLEIVLNNYELRNFATFNYVPVERAGHYENKGYYELTKNPVSRAFKEYRGDWERDVQKPARQFVVPSPYQSGENNFLRDCLLMDFPYLKNYGFDCYKFERDTGEFYVKTGEKGVSLYVPFKALQEKDPQIIIDRMNTYWKWYYNSPDKKKYLDKQLGGLESETAKKLFEDIVSSTETNDSDYSRCNNCMRIFSEDRLELLVQESLYQDQEKPHKTWYEFTIGKPLTHNPYVLFKGCPFCKTDAFLTEIE